MSIWTVSSVALIGLWVFAVPAEADQAQVTGVVTYSDRAMLPVDALLLVTLEDVSRAGAPAQVLATFELENLGAPPFPFVLSYDTDMIDQLFTYAVRARVTSGDSLLLISDTHTPVITNGAISDIEIIMRRVADLSDGDGGLHALPDLPLPATYLGSVSRAEGTGEEWQLDLWPDRVFHLKRTFGDARGGADIGRWSCDQDDSILTLHGGRDAPVTFAIADAGLRLVDPSLDMSAYPLDPAAVALFLTGMLGFAPEGGVFAECVTGRIYPVAQEGACADAAAAYAATSGRRDDAPLFASLKGRLTPRPTADTPDGMALVIESFSRFDQDQQSCPAPFSSDQ